MLDTVMVFEIGVVTFIIFSVIIGWSYFDSKRFKEMLNDKDI